VVFARQWGGQTEWGRAGHSILITGHTAPAIYGWPTNWRNTPVGVAIRRSTSVYAVCRKNCASVRYS